MPPGRRLARVLVKAELNLRRKHRACQIPEALPRVREGWRFDVNGGHYPLLADEDLISFVGDGDTQAFAVLYDRHSRAAYSLAYRR